MLTPCVCLSVWPSEQVIGDVGYAARETLNYLHRVCVCACPCGLPTNYRLQQTTACTNHLTPNDGLHQQPFTPNHGLHQPPFTPNHGCTNHLTPNDGLHQPPFTPNHGLHQPRFAPATVYTNHGLHQTNSCFAAADSRLREHKSTCEWLRQRSGVKSDI